MTNRGQYWRMNGALVSTKSMKKDFNRLNLIDNKKIMSRNSMNRSSRRSVMTVPKEKETGILCVFFKAVHRVTSPSLGIAILDR